LSYFSDVLRDSIQRRILRTFLSNLRRNTGLLVGPEYWNKLMKSNRCCCSYEHMYIGRRSARKSVG